MGLSIQVGGFEESELYAPLTRALEEAGLAPHVEPEALRNECAFSAGMWGYSGLHYLRRIAAYLGQGKEVPCRGDNNASKDPVLARYYDLMAPGFEHLVLHSDAEGFYVPRDLKSVIFPRDELKVPGCMIGSSVRLLDECRRLAAWLELPLDTEEESDEVWEAADDPKSEGPKWMQYGVESFTCIRLIRAAEASMQSGGAIVFC